MSAYTLSLTNELSTDKSVRVCPNTVEPIFLHNSFSLITTRQDLFLGFLLNRNVKVSAYVPSQIVAADMDMATGNDITTTTAIEKSFADNALTLKTVGGAVAQGQGLYTNTVVVKYKNK